MNRTLGALALVFTVVGVSSAVCAQTPAPSVPPAPSQTFSDPAISFTAPAGFTPVPLPYHENGNPSQFQTLTPVAMWVHNRGRQSERTIILQVQAYQDPLSNFVSDTEGGMRNHLKYCFFHKRQPATFANGMPAFFEEVQYGTGFNEQTQFQYMWIDGARGVILSETSRFGSLDAKTAKKDLAHIYAVAYPAHQF